MRKLHGLFLLLCLTFGLIVQGAHADTAGSREGVALADMARFRAHVIEMLKDDWRVTEVSADPENPDAIRLAQRRIHYPMSQDVDLRDLFNRLSGHPLAETDSLIASFFEEDVFRPFSQGLVRGAYPVIWPREIIDRWLEKYPDLRDPALPAFVPLSPDAIIAIVNGKGTAGIVLRNYDFVDMSKDKMLAITIANMEKEIENVAPVRGNDGVDTIPQAIIEGQNARIVATSVLSDLFWRNLEKEYAAGVYVAFPHELAPFGTASVTLVDKGNPEAKKIIRTMIDNTRKAALSRQVGPINCDNEENLLRLSEQKPQSTAGERKLAELFAARVKRCHEDKELQRAGKLPAPEFTPVSSFIYERRDGRLEVVAE